MSKGAIYISFVALVGAALGYSASINVSLLDVACESLFSSTRPLANEAGGGVLPFLLYEASPVERMGILLLAASAEELLFRKVGFMLLRSRGFSTVVCVAVSSLSFGLTHSPNGWVAVLLTTAVGLLLGTLFSYRGDRVDLPILVHFSYNMSFFVLLGDGDSSASSTASLVWPWWHYLLASGAAYLATLALLREKQLLNKMQHSRFPA